jgi:hypothetical protein
MQNSKTRFFSTLIWSVLLSLLLGFLAIVPKSTPPKLDDGWFTRQFLDKENCVPEPYLNYDSTRKELNSLERHGYTARILAAKYASAAYPIRETFFDLPATEITIPMDDQVTWWTVKVEASAKQLQSNIEDTLGLKVPINPPSGTDDGVASIYTNEKGTYYSCFDGRI